jgi:hypothetical protein
MQDRERVGRDASPTTAVLDSQSVKTMEAGGPSGYDAGKKIKGRKRHALVDTGGRGFKLHTIPPMCRIAMAAGCCWWPPERAFRLSSVCSPMPAMREKRVAHATRITVEVVRKQAGQVGFAVQPRRWAVERFFAWLGRNRRLARDFEATVASAQALLYAASAMLKKL